MGLAKQQFIGKFCQPNALITFREYLNDYASDKTREAGNALIERELAKMSPSRERNVRGCLQKKPMRVNGISIFKWHLIYFLSPACSCILALTLAPY